jgi:hypothetical protein
LTVPLICAVDTDCAAAFAKERKTISSAEAGIPDEPHVSSVQRRQKRGEIYHQNGVLFADHGRSRISLDKAAAMDDRALIRRCRRTRRGRPHGRPYTLKVGPYLLAAQQRPAARADSAALDTVQIRDNVWVIFGAGGNVTVHVGEDGVMLVDSGSEPMAEKTLEAVRAITKAPIRMIINTSADPEHVGGNDKVGRGRFRDQSGQFQ